MKSILVLALLFNFSLCTQLISDDSSATSSKIVGGGTANLNEVYYHVSVQIRNFIDSYKHYCNGVVVSLSHVLTGAFCMYMEVGPNDYKLIEPNQLRLISDTVTLNNPAAQYRLVSRLILHEDFSMLNLYYNDIGIMLLTTPFESTPTLRPIQFRNNYTETGESCILSGYGAAHAGGPISNSLRRVPLPISDHWGCKNIYQSYKKLNVTDEMLCAGDSDKDSCEGDGGGPLVCAGELTGIVTFGDDCYHPFYIGVYIEIYKYIDWINDQITLT